jgi:hypothetical protein
MVDILGCRMDRRSGFAVRVYAERSRMFASCVRYQGDEHMNVILRGVSSMLPRLPGNIDVKILSQTFLFC